jgi:hypothetical protein
MANLAVYLLKVANLRAVDHHLRYPGMLRRPPVEVSATKFSGCTGAGTGGADGRADGSAAGAYTRPLFSST